MVNEKRQNMTEQDAIVAAEQELSVCRYIAECTRNSGMRAIHRKRCEWLSVLVGLAKKAIKVDAVEVVHGRWNEINQIATGLPWKYRCNKCGYPQDYAHNYCPNCGAKMDGGNEE